MRRRIRPHLTYANVVATLALFLVLAGGTALASRADISGGAETCAQPLQKYGSICAESVGETHWQAAIRHCAKRGFRLPTFSEAMTLALGYDVPGVGPSQYFWTDDVYYGQHLPVATYYAGVMEDFVSEPSHLVPGFLRVGVSAHTVCVDDPSA
jgi:hypothetical protein